MSAVTRSSRIGACVLVLTLAAGADLYAQCSADAPLDTATVARVDVLYPGFVEILEIGNDVARNRLTEVLANRATADAVDVLAWMTRNCPRDPLRVPRDGSGCRLRHIAVRLGLRRRDEHTGWVGVALQRDDPVMKSPSDNSNSRDISDLIDRGQFGEAAVLARRLANAGDTHAQLTLGWLYHVGKGVEEDLAQRVGIRRGTCLVRASCDPRLRAGNVPARSNVPPRAGRFARPRCSAQLQRAGCPGRPSVCPTRPCSGTVERTTRLVARACRPVPNAPDRLDRPPHGIAGPRGRHAVPPVGTPDDRTRVHRAAAGDCSTIHGTGSGAHGGPPVFLRRRKQFEVRLGPYRSPRVDHLGDSAALRAARVREVLRPFNAERSPGASERPSLACCVSALTRA